MFKKIFGFLAVFIMMSCLMTVTVSADEKMTKELTTLPIRPPPLTALQIYGQSKTGLNTEKAFRTFQKWDFQAEK